MKVEEICSVLNGELVCGSDKSQREVTHAFASDLMSDVLTIERDNILLITGLANMQAIRTSEMSEINCIIFARDKKVGEDMIELARENRMTLIGSPHSLFHISGELYKAGLKSVY